MYVLTRTKPKQVRYKGFAISVFRSENAKDAVAPAKYIVAKLTICRNELLNLKRVYDLYGYYDMVEIPSKS